MKKVVALGLLGLIGISAAYYAAPKTLTVNGLDTPNGVIEKNGKLYVSADALKKGGAQVSTAGNKLNVNFVPLGGRNQADAVEGVLGEWIQNDGWRIRIEEIVLAENPFGKGPGFAMKVEMRNLHKRAISPFASGMDKLQVIDKGGHIVAFNQPKFKEYFADVPPGGGFSTTILFGDPTNKIAELGGAEKVLIFFRKTGNTQLKNFRVVVKED